MEDPALSEQRTHMLLKYLWITDNNKDEQIRYYK